MFIAATPSPSPKGLSVYADTLISSDELIGLKLFQNAGRFVNLLLAEGPYPVESLDPNLIGTMLAAHLLLFEFWSVDQKMLKF